MEDIQETYKQLVNDAVTKYQEYLRSDYEAHANKNDSIVQETSKQNRILWTEAENTIRSFLLALNG
jgi:hypothetical protein